MSILLILSKNGAAPPRQNATKSAKSRNHLFILSLKALFNQKQHQADSEGFWKQRFAAKCVVFLFLHLKLLSPRVICFFPMSSLRSFLFVTVVLLVTVGGGYWLLDLTRPPEPLSPELDTPKLSMAQIAPSQHSKPLFFTMTALPYVKEHWDEWGKAYHSPSLLAEEIAVPCDAALQSVENWNVLDHKWRFGTLLLMGDPAYFRPLLEYLRKSPEWTLTQLDPTSLVFERGAARAWTLTDLPQLLAVFQTHSATEQKSARIAIAHRLMYLKEIPTARRLLEEALKMEPRSKQAWTEMAQLHGMQGEWQESLAAAEHALASDSLYRPAQHAQAHALYSLGAFDRALNITRQLYQAAPADLPTLLLHAKATHASHAFVEEIDVLQRMIALLEANSQPVGPWQAYLGQAYASAGNGLVAQDLFKTALKDETLSDAQRAYVQKFLDRMDSKSDLLNIGPAFPESSLLDAAEYRP